MNTKHLKPILTKAFLTCFIIIGVYCPAWAECPTIQKIQPGFQKVFQGWELSNIRPSEGAGICELQVKFRGQNRILYVDAKGDYILAGSLMELNTGKNVTMEATQALNRMTPDEMKQLESLTAFSAGKSEKILYFVTDPQCPYCKKAEEIAKKMVDKGELTVRYLLYPLPMHKGAKEQCIATICDKKGPEGLANGYKSENQCPEGVKKVEDSMAFLQAKGIGSTPTFIFADGSFLPGMMPEDAFRKRLGLPPAQPQAGPEVKSAEKPVKK